MSEPITEDWLKANGWELYEDQGCRSWFLQYKFDDAALFIGSAWLWICDHKDGNWDARACLYGPVLIREFSDTARLIKLIEALTGKEWPCK